MSITPAAPTPRRDFLAGIATAAAAVGISSAFTGEAAAQPVAADPKLDAWFARIKGTHRQIFDAPEPNSGMPAIWPRVYLNSMKATYGATGGGTAVVILRHGGLPLAFQDSVWAKYKLGEQFDIMDGDKPALRNPYANITNLPIPGLGIAALLSDGVLVGACDVALTVYSSQAAGKMSMTPEAVKAEWIAGLLPGVQVVPSGVMAVGRAQELRCTYCFAG
ncbi:MAG: twin-arginine translocation signal domain-containing protein [Longimicrobiales bacterium]